MYLQCYINENGDKVYTTKALLVTVQIEYADDLFLSGVGRERQVLMIPNLIDNCKLFCVQKESPLGLATQSAHPARFSPDDKFARQRVLLKKRFGLLPTQQPPPKY
ncbi:hypothetical protein ACJIZ3_016860 [Penstemon smallii]|uniref:Nucleolar protein 10 n=1 Tax=Penstemon smallii TaxID=265156 RepID=A0ABD3SV17_9LAMI